MAVRKNFQNDNQKFKDKNHRTDIYNPAFNSPIKAQTDKQAKGFEANLPKWIQLVSFFRWYPDLWWDLITPELGSIRLDLDQRIFLRCLARFTSTYGVFPRGYGKTLLEVMGMYHTAVFFPDIQLSMTAQTKENASKILKEKHDELMRFYPLLANEVSKVNFSKDTFECHFQSGSRIDILANQQSTKGSRRKRINVEESALLNNALFEDVIEPIVNVPRRTIGKLAAVNPEELNGQINFFTTSGFRGSDEYQRSLSMFKEMVELKGKIVIGSSWELAESYGRGEARSVILEKKAKLSPIFFAQNYESKWVGATDGALVNINKLMDIRTLTKPELVAEENGEYVLAMDVARSEATSNNQSSIAVLKIKRAKDDKILRIQLVNIINIANNLTFEAQARILKKMKMIFNPVAVVVDANGLGIGLVDELIKNAVDPDTGDSLGCWEIKNQMDLEDRIAESYEAEDILYALKSQGINHEIIVNFMNMVESGKLQLLEKVQNSGYDINDADYFKDNVLPFIQTDLFIEEVANLKTKVGGNGKLQIEKQIKRIDKDRYSAVAYGLYYIKAFIMDEFNGSREFKATDFCFVN